MAVGNRAISNTFSSSSSGSNMPKRYIGILFFCCFLVIWRTVTDEAGAAVSTGSAAATAAVQQQLQLQLVQQLQLSANSSKPNQIHEPSRTQQQQIISNLSSYSNFSPNLVSLDNAATPAPTPTAASRSSSASTPSAEVQPAQLPPDANQLIDLHQFGYLMEQPACEPHTLALILVHTAPKNAQKRSLIRQTWGGPAMTAAPSPLRVVFLLGAVPFVEQSLQHALEWENRQHGDMVQGNFQDAYRNMTYKHVMALKWFSSHCPRAELLIKVDDDVYVNTPYLQKLLREQQLQQQQPSPMSPQPNSNRTLRHSRLSALLQQPHELLFCKPVIRSRVKRSYRSKWRVSFREYPAHYYPPYCPGFAIIYSPDVVQRLYQAAQQSSYFWVDDVHVTGVLAQRTNTTITTLKPYVLYEQACNSFLAGNRDLAQHEFLFTWHSISPRQVHSLWRLQMLPNFTNLEERGANAVWNLGLESGLS